VICKEDFMQPQVVYQKPKPKIAYYEICCKACRLLQIYHGKTDTKCVHCRTPLDLADLKTRYQ